MKTGVLAQFTVSLEMNLAEFVALYELTSGMDKEKCTTSNSERHAVFTKLFDVKDSLLEQGYYPKPKE